MPRVLVIEDDGVIARSMSAHLRHAGLDVEWAEDGERGLRKLRFERPDVCVVDLMLPGLDGWAVTERARAEGITTPIIVVSARGSEHDKVHTLEIGADDYLAKPFGMRELVARVNAALRRSRIAPAQEEAGAIEVPGLAIDPAQQRAFLVDDEGARNDARLTPTEFRLLLVLAQGSPRTMSRDELQQRVWNVPYRARDRSVDVCVRKLRDKLERPSGRTFLHTHYGVGYRFDAAPAIGVILLRRRGPLLELVAEGARNAAAAAHICAGLYDRHPEDGRPLERLRWAEAEAERLTAALLYRLDRARVSPVRREDLVGLAAALDELCGRIARAGGALDLLGIEAVPEHARAQARLVAAACDRLVDAAERMPADLSCEVEDVAALEDEGDRIRRDALARLFAATEDALATVRLVELHAGLEAALDAAQRAMRRLGATALSRR